MKAMQIELTKAAVKGYLTKASEDRKVSLCSAKAMRLATFRVVCDILDVKDAELRKEAWVVFESSPGWFASNASAAMAAYGLKGKTEEVFDEFNV